MSRSLTKQPTARTARDRAIGARPWQGRGAFVPVSDSAGFARGIASRWRFAGGLLPGADLALLAIRRVGGMGSIRQLLRFGIHLNLQQTLWRGLDRLPVFGERMPVAERWLRQTEGPDAREPMPAVASPPTLILQTTTLPARWLPSLAAGVRAGQPRTDPSLRREEQFARVPMALGRRLDAVEMIELRSQRRFRSTPPLEMRVRRDLPAGPMQAPPPLAFAESPAGRERQPPPVAQAPNVRHLADEVLAIIDRRATAARERLERR